MKSYLKEEWRGMREFRGERINRSCPHSDGDKVELWNWDSTVRGRIDAVWCKRCGGVVDWKIIR